MKREKIIEEWGEYCSGCEEAESCDDPEKKADCFLTFLRREFDGKIKFGEVRDGKEKGK